MKKKSLHPIVCACAMIFCTAVLYAKPAAVVLDIDQPGSAVVKYKGKKDVPLTVYMQLEPGAIIVVKKTSTIKLTFLATDTVSVIKKPGTYRINAKGKMVPDKKSPVTVAKMDFESTITKYGKNTGGTRGVNDDLPAVCNDEKLEKKIEEVENQEKLDDYVKSLLIYSIYLDAGCNELAAQEARSIQQLKAGMKGKK
jgi:hypothetical protein